MALATLSQSGYSVKPLHEKLGYMEGETVAFIALPDELSDLPSLVEFGKIARRQDLSRPVGPTVYDMIHAFTTSRLNLPPVCRGYANTCSQMAHSGSRGRRRRRA